jgi:hypothetical protein
VHIKGIHINAVDAISRLDIDPVQDEKAKWIMDDVQEVLVPLHHDRSYRREYTNSPTPNKHGVCNHNEEDVIYPLTVKEIAQAQEDNSVLKKLSKTVSIPLK